MLKRSINALTKFAPLMMPELLFNARLETVRYDDYAKVVFHLDSNVDIHKLSSVLKKEMEMNTLAMSYDKAADRQVLSCFSYPKGGFMWKAYARSFNDSLVDTVSFTIYTSMEQMFVELQDDLRVLTDDDMYLCEDEIDSSSLVLFFQ